MEILIIVAIVLVFLVVTGKGLWGARTRNSIVTFVNSDKGFCIDCKHCRHDTSHRFSDTDYVCSLSKCKDITPNTRMQCCEKPKITEEDLQELFSLGVWTSSGQNFIRQSLLGFRMSPSEVDEFLKRIPDEHPEYIDQAKKSEYLRNNS